MWIDDVILKEHRKDFFANIFVPSKPLVVLGSSNDESREVNLDYCQSAKIPVVKRYGGGGCVVLYPGVVVVSAGAWMKDSFQNSFYFKMFNQAVINSLASQWPSLSSLGQSGISDIVSGEKKVAGTSMFRSRHYLIYQASLLVDLDLELVSATLQHPSKEPDYRRGRSHKDFLTDLKSALAQSTSGKLSAQQVCDCLASTFERELKKIGQEHLQPSMASEWRALEERLERAEKAE